MYNIVLALVLCTLAATPMALAHAATAANSSGHSFSQAKKILMQRVYQDHRITFYAGCRYDRKGVIEAKSCGYLPRRNRKRGQHLEWEHIVPAWAFGHALQCWQQLLCTTGKGKHYKGRRCCRNNDPRFRAMESDMHNLVPAIGELNGDRSNFRYGMIPGEPRVYGTVDFEVDTHLRIAEPAPGIRGDIARTYFYMAKAYGLRISKKQQQLFAIWSRQDPVDAWERERNNRITSLQGNRNPFVH